MTDMCHSHISWIFGHIGEWPSTNVNPLKDGLPYPMFSMFWPWYCHDSQIHSLEHRFTATDVLICIDICPRPLGLSQLEIDSGMGQSRSKPMIPDLFWGINIIEHHWTSTAIFYLLAILLWKPVVLGLPHSQSEKKIHSQSLNPSGTVVFVPIAMWPVRRFDGARSCAVRAKPRIACSGWRLPGRILANRCLDQEARTKL